MSHEDYPKGSIGGGPGDMRDAPRFNLLIRPAKLVTAAGEYLCVLRDVSMTGLKVRTFHALPPQPQMTLELGNGDRYEVERVWERDDHAGLRFAAGVPIEYLLNEEGPFRKRPVRLRISLDAVLIAGLQTITVRMLDLSQQGARIECPAHLALDQQVRFEIAGLSPIVAKVRWRRPPTAGLIFEQTFKLDEFARIAFKLQPLAEADGAEGAHTAARYA